MNRRDLFRVSLAAAAAALPRPLFGRAGVAAAQPPVLDLARLQAWVAALRGAGLARRELPAGRAAVRVGELALGTPYVAHTLEEYLKAGGDARALEPLTLWLTRFDCQLLVESCLALARLAATSAEPTWEAFGREVERVRYRGGQRDSYASRLHYFSEWIADNQERGLVRDLGRELGGVPDARPLRFMTAKRESYPALQDPEVFAQIQEYERRLDGTPRYVVPTAKLAEVADRIQTGDVLALATGLEGLDVSHAVFAYRDEQGALRVLHAPLSGGHVEITPETLPEYVAARKRATGILVARPLWG